MQKRRVIMRADAGRNIGFGHFVRTSALASLLSNDFDCKIASFSPDNAAMSQYQLDLIAAAGAFPWSIEGEDYRAYDPNFLNSITPDDIVVLDNYYFTTEYQQLVSERARALVYIDDMHQRFSPANLLITFCPLSRSDFSLHDDAAFLGGIEYSLLRPPFLSSLPHRDPHVKINRVVLAMGGADPYRLTNKMIKAIRNIAPSLHIDVMAGPTVTIDDDIFADSQSEAKIKLHSRLSADEVADLFDAAHLGIFPASTVCVEAFSRALPVAAGYFVDNQEEFYHHAVCHNWVSPLGNLLDSEDEIANRLRRIIAAHEIVRPPKIDFEQARQRILNEFSKL